MDKKSNLVPRKKIKKIQLFRTVIQGISTFILSYGAYILGENRGFYVPVFQCVYVNGKTANGICKSLTNINGFIEKINGTTLFYLLLMIGSILLLGKIWCGFICPFGFFQDILTIIRRKLKISPITISTKMRPIVKLCKWLVLICLIFGIGFCRLCPVKYIMMPLAGSFPGFNIAGIIIAGVVSGLCFMKESAFCEVCPLGTLMGLFNKVSAVRIKKSCAGCTRCRACVEVCPMGIESIYQIKNNPDVTHSDCIMCMKCIEACPEDKVLSLTFLRKKILVSKRRDKGNERKNKRAI
ncbi:Polyferredoxin [Clostridium bornimense]|uniref:Polyferredoxin n=1 Tax=Clostridium bornimense TaxID=1216932 RepID=W6S310_9CLOT|nr:4Fe-4S binding protein [Clostridium bornimense]CDM70299.1 Polyferredoxin [Clostridium bornimense]